jgi:hypothetical protein
MVFRISRGPTPTTGNARPSSFPLKNSSSAPPPTTESSPTQAFDPITSAEGSTSHDLRLLSP